MRFRTLWFGVIVSIVFALPCAAQHGNEISIPATPAFSILGFEPASVMRPTNPQELSADILNSFDQNGKLLMNLGIEVAPYWLGSRDSLLRDDYLNPTPWQSFKQTLMLSAATVKDSVSGNNKLGTGFRFKLAGGKVSPEFNRKESELKARSTFSAIVASALAYINMTDPNLRFTTKREVVEHVETTLMESETNLGGYVDEFRNYATEDSASYSNATSDLVRYVQSINAKVIAGSDQVQRDVVALSKKRIGTIAELAGAASFFTGTHDKFGKAGVWVNVSHVVSVNDAFAFSARYFFSGTDSTITSLDAGLSYIKEVTNFSVSIEGMVRSFRAEMPDISIANEPITRVDKDFTYRLAAQASYRIAQDISVNLSLGKDFDAPFLDRSGFFSIFGINYNIFKRAKALLPEAP